MQKLKTVVLNCTEDVYPSEWLKENSAKILDGICNCKNMEVLSIYKIGNEAQAKAADMEMMTMDIGFIIVNLVSWHITPYVMYILKNRPQIPVLVYSMAGKKDATGKLHAPAAPAAITALLPALKQFGHKVRVIYEIPGDEHKLDEIEAYADVVLAYHKVKTSRIGLIGYADMGLFSCAYDKADVYDKLGIEIEDYFSYEIGKTMDEADPAVIEPIKEEIRGRVVFTNVVSEKALDRAARLYYAMKGKADERQLDAISIKCVTGATKHMGINPCMAQSLLANKDLAVICECDAFGLITSVIFSAVTGQTSAFVENYEFLEKEVLVGVCGFIPQDFVDGEFKFKASRLGDFFIGISNISKMKTGTFTFGRLFRKADGGYAMFLSRAKGSEPMKWTELGWEEPTPDFPSLLLEPEMEVRHYVENVPGQHIILLQGDHYDKVAELCKLLGIEVVG